jgi:ketosteroid isomerase-like protein
MPSAKIASSVLQDLLDAFNSHDVDAIMSCFAEDCVLDMPHGPRPAGRHRHRVRGDRAVSEWTLRGTQRTGERIEVRGCDLFEFVDGKISCKDSFWKIVD